MMGVRGENIKIFLAWLYSGAFFGEYLNKVSGLITIQPNNKTLHGMERDCFGNEKKIFFKFFNHPQSQTCQFYFNPLQLLQSKTS